MSYQVLARKWRPKRFAELVGQEHVKNTLINALEMGRLHHAYLFTGTRGVGKTTIARIFAKSLNCEQGVSAEPCGQCDTCLAIENGHYVDLIEIDAASRTKVEDTREILDNVQYAPSRGSYKVYLIDEVHMLTRHSFNALLKTLEEPPEHVKFLLATTDPQKLPITILSRCLQFNLKALLRSEIKGHLEHILQQESINFDDEALTLLAKAADGSLRDALSLTDQAIAQSAGSLDLPVIEKMLGTIDKQWSVKLLAHIVNNDAAGAMTTVEEIAQFMPDYKHLVDQLLSIFHLGAMTQLVPTAAQVDESLQGFITRLAQKLSAEDIQLYYQILLNGKNDLALAPDPRSGFEMLLLRLLAFRPVKVVGRPVGEVVRTEPLPEQSETPSAQVQQSHDEPPLEVPQSPVSNEISAAPEVSVTSEVQAETPVVRPEMPQAPEPAPDENALQLDEQTLNAQQDSILAAAEHQGYKPVDNSLPAEQLSGVDNENIPPAQSNEPAELVEQSVAEQSFTDQGIAEQDVQNPSAPQASEPQTQSAGPGAGLSLEAAKQKLAEAKREPGQPSPQTSQSNPQQQVPQAQPEFEDPVAAILANRNLSLDDMFSASSQLTNNEQTQPFQSEQQPEQPTQPMAGEDSGKKPEIELESSFQADDYSQSSDARDNGPHAPQQQWQQPVEEHVQQPIESSPQQDIPHNTVQASAPVELEPFNQSEHLANEQQPVQEAVEQASQLSEPTIESEPQLEEQPASELLEQSSQEPQEPELPRWAHQVDEWASLIEQMGLGGLVRLLAVQSVWQKNGKEVLLTTFQSEKHLDSKGLRDQLQRGLSLVLNEPVELDIQFTDQRFNTPLNIQRQIDADRLARAKQLIYQDPLIVAMQQQFGAEVYDDSIQAVG